MFATPQNDNSPVAEAYHSGTSTRFCGDRWTANATTEVAVIGGGITGLVAALTLAGMGIEVVVLEARHVGYGASGRAFGQVVPYAKYDQAWLERRFGTQAGSALINFIASGPDWVFHLIERHGIECESMRVGTLLAAHHQRMEPALARQAQYWRQRGVAVQLLRDRELAELTGTSRYRLALLDPRNGTLNGYQYALGLAHAARTAGAGVFEQTRVERVQRDGGRWVLHTQQGDLIARRLIVACNAYCDDVWPALGRSVIAMRAYGLITRAIDPSLRQQVLPGGQSLMDTRHLYSGIRRWRDGRVHVSADGPPFRFGGADREKARRRLLASFPMLAGFEWEEEWAGWIAVSPGQFPALHQLADSAFAAIGYSGRGIAFASLLGRELAHRVCPRRNEANAFPITPLRPLPSRFAAMAWAQTIVASYRAMDAWSLRGVE